MWDNNVTALPSLSLVTRLYGAAARPSRLTTPLSRLGPLHLLPNHSTQITRGPRNY